MVNKPVARRLFSSKSASELGLKSPNGRSDDESLASDPRDIDTSCSSDQNVESGGDGQQADSWLSTSFGRMTWQLGVVVVIVLFALSFQRELSSQSLLSHVQHVLSRKHTPPDLEGSPTGPHDTSSGPQDTSAGSRHSAPVEPWPVLHCKPREAQEVISRLSSLHHKYRRGEASLVFGDPIPRIIHQTYGKSPGHFGNGPMEVWGRLHPGFEYVVWSDESGRGFVKECLPSVLPLYDGAPGGVMRSDMLRYLLLLTFGGIWADADTVPLKRYNSWLQGVEGNPSFASTRFIAAVQGEFDKEEQMDEQFIALFQIVQWAMAAEPGHPVVRLVVQTVLRSTAELIRRVFSLDNLASRAEDANSTVAQGSNALSKAEPVDALGDIDPVPLLPPNSKATRAVTKRDILNVTGPGAWTHGIEWGLRQQGLGLSALHNLTAGRVFGDMVMLPKAAFQGGVGIEGMGGSGDEEERVKHLFAGTWRPLFKDRRRLKG